LEHGPFFKKYITGMNEREEKIRNGRFETFQVDTFFLNMIQILFSFSSPFFALISFSYILVMVSHSQSITGHGL